MNQLIISLLLALFQPSAAAASTCTDPSTARLVQDSQTVVVAELVEVKPALGIWSGLFLSVQRVRYEVKDVLKGEVRDRIINVGHYIVANSSTADEKEARLSPKLFTKGSKVILFLSPDPAKGYLSNPDDDKHAAYLALDSRCGLLSADTKTLKYVKEYISAK